MERAVELIMDSEGSIENVHDLMSETNANFITEMMTFLLNRVNRAMGHCLICDHKIEIEGYEGFDCEKIPTLCTQGTCQFNVLELGICNTLEMAICPSALSIDIINNPDVADLLISMCFSACTSSRRDLIFDPFPPDYINNNVRDYNHLEKVLELIPSISDMEKYGKTELELRNYLLKIDSQDRVYKLVKWILSVQRAALLKMPPTNQIKSCGTEYQYLMMGCSDPTKAAKFRENRKKYGSYFAFHGSSIENWHSILRKGLVNASNTKLMTTGAAYGAGVYMAAESSVSVGYARTGKSWKKSKFGDSSSLMCLAICEVVKAEGVPTTANPYYVVQEAQHVNTRFFLFYPKGMQGTSIKADSLDLHKYVQ